MYSLFLRNFIQASKAKYAYPSKCSMYAISSSSKVQNVENKKAELKATSNDCNNNLHDGKFEENSGQSIGLDSDIIVCEQPGALKSQNGEVFSIQLDSYTL